MSALALASTDLFYTASLGYALNSEGGGVGVPVMKDGTRSTVVLGPETHLAWTNSKAGFVPNGSNRSTKFSLRGPLRHEATLSISPGRAYLRMGRPGDTQVEQFTAKMPNGGDPFFATSTRVVYRKDQMDLVELAWRVFQPTHNTGEAIGQLIGLEEFTREMAGRLSGGSVGVLDFPGTWQVAEGARALVVGEEKAGCNLVFSVVGQRITHAEFTQGERISPILDARVRASLGMLR